MGEPEVTCSVHSDREAFAVCQKYELGYCEECFGSERCTCIIPKMYCKFRTACMIWALCKRREGKLVEG